MGDLVKISPEGLEVANAYLVNGSITETAASLCVTEEVVSGVLSKPEIKRYIDSIYLDQGYRNRFKLGSLMDEIIESKLEEARDSEMYSSKDLIEIITLAHKMRMDEVKALEATQTIKNQTNVQINAENPFGGGNYGKLMEKLVGGNNS